MSECLLLKQDKAKSFFQAEGTGVEPATPVKGHLISSEAASHSLTLRLVRFSLFSHRLNLEFYAKKTGLTRFPTTFLLCVPL